jgi:tetratricopeptide (TPR) repeat protein
MAISVSTNKQNHVYYANRALAYLHLDKYQECVEDCDIAISIENRYKKSYLRKAEAYKKLKSNAAALGTIMDGLKVLPHDLDLSMMGEKI